MVENGSLVSSEADREFSNTLIDLILDKEVIGSGEIYIDQGFYERFTVEEYMRYYTEIIDSKSNYREIMLKFSLLEIADK
ncbi:hypothetical protein [Clostridium beijerinckii]|uniref:hypothetical protein n=1 Tax=Clostridium beijerinckii TaxID=1520 RepID=UPI0014942490|nr:hypothetical protein [Clostridium beijerinckii]MBE6090959.1 hypothetical protein [Clostridium beijerinckii]NOW88790.1 hypothetical protein [Clostridium beijerinckii]